MTITFFLLLNQASVSKWYSLLIKSKMQPGLNVSLDFVEKCLKKCAVCAVYFLSQEQLVNQLTQIKDICHYCLVLCQTAQQVVAPQFEQL